MKLKKEPRKGAPSLIIINQFCSLCAWLERAKKNPEPLLVRDEGGLPLGNMFYLKLLS